MAAVAGVKPNTDSVGAERASRIYTVTGAADAGAAVDAVVARIAADGMETWHGLPWRANTAQLVASRHGAYEVTSEWGSASGSPHHATGSVSHEWQTRLESARVTQSLATVGRYGPGAKQHNRAVGVTHDPGGGVRIEGADVLTPVSSFSVVIRPENAAVTATYRALAARYVGSVNSATFVGHPAGEVLFAGLSGGVRDATDSELRLEFLVSANQSALVIAGITVASKNGWDYLWVERRAAESAEAGAEGELESTVVAVYVEQMYPYRDLNDLVI